MLAYCGQIPKQLRFFNLVQKLFKVEKCHFRDYNVKNGANVLSQHNDF